MKLRYKIFFGLFLCSLSLFADNNRELEELAALHYQSGEYTKAIEIYSQVLASNVESTNLYFNLGNSYYKAGDIARAILNYERALLLNPGDSDVKYNLAMAQRATVDKINVLPQLFFVRWYNNFVSSISADRWAWSAVVLFVVFLIMVALFFLSTTVAMRKTGFAMGTISLLLFFATLIFANKQYHRISDRNSAIVMTPSVTVRGAPDNSGTELFIIHEGLKVDIVGKLGEWCNIRVADGNEGWIKADDMERI